MRIETFKVKKINAHRGALIFLTCTLSALLSDSALASVSSDFPELDFYRFQTPRVGALLGQGPAFGMNVDLPADATHFIAVRACGPGQPDARASGSASNVTSARWVIPPDVAQPIIPWPARPLPGRFDHRLPIEQYTTGEGPIWPVIPSVEYGVPTMFLVGVTRHPMDSSSAGAYATLQAPEPPEHYLFRLRETLGSADPLTEMMPFMLFRYQLPSARFPSAKANVVQCTPLIDRMSWRRLEGKDGKALYEIRDPWFRFIGSSSLRAPIPVAGTWDDLKGPTLADPANLTDPPPYLENHTGLIFLVDPLPATVNARYRHIIVQFDERGEILRVIPLQPVQH